MGRRAASASGGSLPPLCDAKWTLLWQPHEYPVTARLAPRSVRRPRGWQVKSGFSFRAREKMRGMSGPRRFIEVKVRPGARESALRQDASGAWFAELRSPPADGKANAELIGLVAKHFGCPKAAVSIKRGASSRLKLLQIESP